MGVERVYEQTEYREFRVYMRIENIGVERIEEQRE